jgi:site-specific DNA-methyltransferase (adenine-specific)
MSGEVRSAECEVRGAEPALPALPVAEGLEPYASGRGWAIYCADVLDLVPRLPAGCVDVVLPDPPYSSGGMFRGDRAKATSAKYVQTEARGAVQNLVDFSGDSRDQRGYLAWCSVWMAMSRAALSPLGFCAVFCDWRQLPVTTDALQAGGFVGRGVLVWDKTEAARPFRGRWRNQCEFLPWGTTGSWAPSEGHRECLPGVFRHSPLAGGVKLHQAGKPEPLMADLIRIALPGELVADWFMGSGTTGVAAIRAGRRFIGADIDPHWCEIAANRLRAAEAEQASAQ